MRALIIANGPVEASDQQLLTETAPFDLKIAVDGGLDRFRELGIDDVDLLVGDLDSVSERANKDAVKNGAEILQFPVDKNASDLELALREATRRGVTEALLLGVFGGRADHMLANVGVLTAADFAGMQLMVSGGGSIGRVVRGRATLDIAVATTISLLAIGAPAGPVTTSGLRWNLAGDMVDPASARTLSNIVQERPIEVLVEAGALLALWNWEE